MEEYYLRMLFRKQYLPWRLEKAAYASWVRLFLTNHISLEAGCTTNKLTLLNSGIATHEAKRYLVTAYVRNCL